MKKKNINRPVTINEIETVILKSSKNKSPGPDGFTGKFYQIFRGELTSILLKLIQKYHRWRNTPKFIQQCHHHPNMKNRQRYHKTWKREFKIPHLRSISIDWRSYGRCGPYLGIYYSLFFFWLWCRRHYNYLFYFLQIFF